MTPQFTYHQAILGKYDFFLFLKLC